MVCGKRVRVTGAERVERFGVGVVDRDDVCDRCLQQRGWQRALDFGRAHQHDRPEQEEASWRRWLDRAPLLDPPTDPVAPSETSGFVSGRPFVEVTDLDTAARECSRGGRGLGLTPETYDDVLFGSYDRPPVSITLWTGSVSRLADGRIVFRWRPLRTLTNDY